MALPSATYETPEAQAKDWLTCNVPGCNYQFKMKGPMVDMNDFRIHKSKHTITELFGLGNDQD